MEAALKQKLTDDLKQAIRGRNKLKSSVIRLIMAAIKNAEIAKQASLDESDILGIITKEARQRKESIEAFKQGNRQDLVAGEEVELAILQEYLPQHPVKNHADNPAQFVVLSHWCDSYSLRNQP